MPKFLFVTIIFLIALGQIFKVEEYSPPPVDNSVAQMVVETKTDEEKGEVEIIKWPLVSGSENEEKLPVPVDGGEDCLYFDGDIPRLDVCKI